MKISLMSQNVESASADTELRRQQVIHTRREKALLIRKLKKTTRQIVD